MFVKNSIENFIVKTKNITIKNLNLVELFVYLPLGSKHHRDLVFVHKTGFRSLLVF